MQQNQIDITKVNDIPFQEVIDSLRMRAADSLSEEELAFLKARESYLSKEDIARFFGKKAKKEETE